VPRFTYGNSTITQEYVLYAGLPRVEIQYSVDWAERNKMLKISLPFYVPDGRAAYEIPFGAISRPMDGQEVPMQKWLDISNDQFGVSVLNDGKYGVDVVQGMVRITALRSPDAPDEKADEGQHRFSIAIVPHEGDWRQAHTTRAAYNFNLPLLARIVEQHTGDLPPSHSFVAIAPDQVVLTALKKSEDDDSWILRFYESSGAPVSASISLPFSATSTSEVDLIEWQERPLAISGQTLNIDLQAWEIKTLKVKP